MPIPTKNPTVTLDHELSNRPAALPNAAAALLRQLCQHASGPRLLVHRGSGAEQPLTESDCRCRIEQMHEGQRRHPNLRLFSLAYQQPDERRGIGRSCPQERASRSIPHIGLPGLTNMAVAP